MPEPLVVSTLVRTCDACPAQWEGRTDDDRPVYIRYRYGLLEVNVGETGMARCILGPTYYYAYLGNPMQGVMSDDDLRRFTATVLLLPSEIPVRWEGQEPADV